MSAIKKVVLIGAGGNLGPSILKALIDANFIVTVLSRESSTATFPSAAAVIKSDYSHNSLVNAFRGQDAVVSTVASTAVGGQNTIIDAAVEAGVKRFLPSEYGCNCDNENALKVVPFFKDKHDTVTYLKEANAKHPEFTWTSVSTGPFFDWGIKVGFLGVNFAEGTASIYDSGDAPFSSTNLSTIGKAVAGVLEHPAETANTLVYVASFTTTQNAILAAVEKATRKTFTKIRRSTAQAKVDGVEKLKSGDTRGGVFDLIHAVAFATGYGNNFEVDPPEGLWNEKLGLPEEDLDTVVKEVFEGKRP